jgi:CIC family chloride channel protein
VKLLAAGFTIGTGGSAGDFAPSLVLGALLGGAFGRAAQLVLGDPNLPVAAFALVGMATFYGGIAHVPVSALVMSCELAGRYDLLVPLMLAGGVAFVALRHRSLYEEQLPSRADSPVHRREQGLGLLIGRRVREVFRPGGGWLTLAPGTPTSELLRRLPEATGQDVFPVVDERGRLTGVVSSESVRLLAGLQSAHAVTCAADLAGPPLATRLDDELKDAAATMLAQGLRELPVVDADGTLLGLLRDADVFRAWLTAAEAAPAAG